eukprot:scaffold822_cov250-Pinguiococcus_pyrenoidosus.AAC.10
MSERKRILKEATGTSVDCFYSAAILLCSKEDDRGAKVVSADFHSQDGEDRRVTTCAAVCEGRGAGVQARPAQPIQPHVPREDSGSRREEGDHLLPGEAHRVHLQGGSLSRRLWNLASAARAA